MSLSRKIADALDASQNVDGAVPGDVTADEGHIQLGLHVQAASPVGVAFDSLTLSVSDRRELPLETLKAWGARLASRLTYLMEPLVLHEADSSRGEVALRSLAPTPRDGGRAYFEVLLDRRGTLRLGRVRFDEQTRLRRSTTCQMSREVVERLADDLAASAETLPC